MSTQTNKTSASTPQAAAPKAPAPANAAQASTATAGAGKTPCVVVNPSSAALNVFAVGQFIDIPSEGRSEVIELDAKGMADLKKRLNRKHPSMSVRKKADLDKADAAKAAAAAKGE